jgi:hypothetical protein
VEASDNKVQLAASPGYLTQTGGFRTYLGQQVYLQDVVNGYKHYHVALLR